MNLRFAINSLSKKIVFTFFTVIQLVAIMVLLMNTFVSSSELSIEADRLLSEYKDEEYYKFKYNTNVLGLEEENKDTQRVSDILEKNKDNIKLMYITQGSIFMDEKAFVDDRVLPLEEIKIQDKRYLPHLTYEVNENIFNNESIKFYKGNGEKFKSIETIKDENPIILGYNYSSKFNISDDFSYIEFLEDGSKVVKNYKVVGILKQGTEMSVSPEPKNKVNTDDLIFVASSHITKGEDRYKENYINNLLGGGYFYAIDNFNVKNLSSELDMVIDDGEIISLKDQIKRYNEELNSYLKPINIFLWAILVFVIISMITTFLNMILKEMKEMGINLLLGATFKDIKLRVVLELILLLAVSSVIGIIIYCTFLGIPENIMVFIMGILKSLLSFGLVFCIVLILPMLKLRSLEISELIRGEE
ncbi:MAG: ABC transporter permease [Clostridium sp.]